MRSVLVLAALFVGLFGCVGGSDDDDDAAGGKADGGRESRDPDSPPETLEGDYELHTSVDLTAAGVLPDFARNTVRSLSRLHDAPAAAMLEMLERSGAPILSTVLSLVPASLQESLAGWIDEWILASVYEDSPATERIAELGDEIGSILSAFELVTVLELSRPADDGSARAAHGLTAMSFWWDGEEHRMDATAWADPPTELDARAVHVLESAPGVEAGILDLGDHSIAVPIGALALQALPELLEPQFGVDTIRDVLGLLVDCDGMATWIAGQCALGVCVGYEEEIAELCGTALDEIAADVEAGITNVELRAMHVTSGTARMWDEPWDSDAKDGVIDSIDAGTFRMGLDLGNGEPPAGDSDASRPTACTFWGARVDDGGEIE